MKRIYMNEPKRNTLDTPSGSKSETVVHEEWSGFYGSKITKVGGKFKAYSCNEMSDDVFESEHDDMIDALNEISTWT
jgi:hypothetical protein